MTSPWHTTILSITCFIATSRAPRAQLALPGAAAAHFLGGLLCRPLRPSARAAAGASFFIPLFSPTFQCVCFPIDQPQPATVSPFWRPPCLPGAAAALACVRARPRGRSGLHPSSIMSIPASSACFIHSYQYSIMSLIAVFPSPPSPPIDRATPLVCGGACCTINPMDPSRSY